MGLIVRAALILALGAQPAVYRAQTVRPPDHTGFVVMYGPGVMEDRVRAHHAPPAPCYVAYTLAHDRDMARLWLHIAGPAGALDCLVVDLPDDSQGHREPLIKRRVWAELGYRNRWICGTHWTGRARDCRVRIWILPR